MSNQNNDIFEPNFNNACPVLSQQDVSVCLPVEIKPFADVSKIKTECIGKPMIKSCDHCKGKEKESCNFTITQKIRVEVPVVFGAETKVGKAHIDCEPEHRPYLDDFGSKDILK